MSTGKIIKLETKVLEAAAKSAGVSPEKFVSEARSISSGRKVCAHFIKCDSVYSFFKV